jgi:hypothetical protein
MLRSKETLGEMDVGEGSACGSISQLCPQGFLAFFSQANL